MHVEADLARMERERRAFILMEEHGGGFGHYLARAWWAADSTNRNRIRAAFGDIIAEYADQAERFPIARGGP